MNKQKLISVLQSRIAKREKQIAHEWFIFHYEGCEFDWDEWDKIGARELAIRLGEFQKQDKAILRQLILDEREIWKLHSERNTAMLALEEIAKVGYYEGTSS